MEVSRTLLLSQKNKDIYQEGLSLGQEVECFQKEVLTTSKRKWISHISEKKKTQQGKQMAKDMGPRIKMRRKVLEFSS